MSDKLPITYTNRFGSVYHLLEKVSPSGRVTRFFTMDPRKGRSLSEMPDGYKAEEKVNGLVFLTRRRSPKIDPGELESVQRTLTEHGKDCFEPWVEKDAIVIYEFNGSRTNRHSPNRDIFQPDFVSRREPGQAVMRFVLIDRKKRLFLPQRFCFRGRVDDWIDVGKPDELTAVAERFVPFLGTEQIYELF